MRVPGSVNAKRGRVCRIVRLDLFRPAVSYERLAARFADPKRGGIYDLASLLEGGPWGAGLRGRAFAEACERLACDGGNDPRVPVA